MKYIYPEIDFMQSSGAVSGTLRNPYTWELLLSSLQGKAGAGFQFSPYSIAGPV